MLDIHIRAAAIIFQKTKNLILVQLLPGHSNLENTDRYPDIEANKTLEVSVHLQRNSSK